LAVHKGECTDRQWAGGHAVGQRAAGQGVSRESRALLHVVGLSSVRMAHERQRGSAAESGLAQSAPMINVVNKSTLVTDADVKVMVQAVAHQLRYDAAPAWGRALIGVTYLPDESSAPPGSWVIAVLDDPDQQDALGWHTENQGEVIFGRVFARPVLQHG